MEQEWGGRGEGGIKSRAEIKEEGAWREVGVREDQSRERGSETGGRRQRQRRPPARQHGTDTRSPLPARRAAVAWHPAGTAQAWHGTRLARRNTGDAFGR